MSRLGDNTRSIRFRAGARHVEMVEPPARPDVIDDGECLEVIWFPHRDALSLVPVNRPTVDSTRQLADCLHLRLLRDRGL